MIASIVLLVATVGGAIVIQACAAGKIGVNPVLGIRLRHLMVNEGAWRAGHRAALVPSWIGAAVVVVFAAVSLVPALSSAEQEAFVLSSAILLLAALLVSTFLADRAALDEVARQTSAGSSA